MSKFLLKLTLASAVVLGAGFGGTASAQDYLVVGGYNRAIASFPFDQEAGQADVKKRVFSQGRSATDLAWCPSRSVLFAVNELNTAEGTGDGTVTSYKVKTLGKSLPRLSRQVTESDLPVSAKMTRDGRYLLVATSGSLPASLSSLAVMPIDEMGKVLPVAQKFTYAGAIPSHIQQVSVAPSGFVYATDAGLGKIYTYAYLPDRDPAFPLLQTQTSFLPPGFAPRDLVFSADGRFAYLSFLNQGGVMVLNVMGDGSLMPRAIIPLDPSVQMGVLVDGSITLSPDGKFLYVTARGDKNIITSFAVNHETGDLTRLQVRPTSGKDSRGIAVSPNGKYLAVSNRGTNEVIIFRRNRTSGKVGQIMQRFLVRSPTTVMFIDDKK